MKINVKGIFKSRKFKYGSTAVLFTCTVIAAVVILNVIFTALASKYMWYVDMTKTQLFTLSDETYSLLDNVDKEITINFCRPLDQLESDSASNLVYQCAKEYASKYDNIKIKHLDIITNPSAVTKYSNTTNAAINTKSVVIESDTDFETYTLDSFFSVDSDSQEVLAFNGELNFTTAILRLSQPQKIAYFTTGHGELNGTNNSRKSLWKLFVKAGYDVREIDLTKETPDEAAQVIVINGPQQDFLGFKTETNEIAKITDFLNKNGNMMVFLDPARKPSEYPELSQLLEDYGVTVSDNILRDTENSLDKDGLRLSAEYPEGNLASSLHEGLRKQDSLPKTVVENARSIVINWSTNTSSTDNVGRREVAPVLTSTVTTGEYDNSEKTDAQAPFNLLTVTRELYVKENNRYYSYVMVCGTTDFADDDYLYNAYGNDDILYAAMRVMGKETVPTNINYKYLEDESLEITNAEANKWTVIVTALLPLAVFAVGTVIQIRRKHL